MASSGSAPFQNGQCVLLSSTRPGPCGCLSGSRQSEPGGLGNQKAPCLLNHTPWQLYGQRRTITISKMYCGWCWENIQFFLRQSMICTLNMQRGFIWKGSALSLYVRILLVRKSPIEANGPTPLPVLTASWVPRYFALNTTTGCTNRRQL